MSRSGRRRFSILSVVGAALTLGAGVVGILVETSPVWAIAAFIGVTTVLCFAQVGRPPVERELPSPEHPSVR